MRYAECRRHGLTIPVSEDGMHEGICGLCEQAEYEAEAAEQDLIDAANNHVNLEG